MFLRSGTGKPDALIGEESIVTAVAPVLQYVRTTDAPGATGCAWCGHKFTAADQRQTGRTRCAQCGVATTSPWPSDAQLSAAYGGWYRPAEGRFSGLGDTVLRRMRATVATRLNRVLPPGPVLDVGAGDGNLVRAFKKHGRDAAGVDPYAAANHPDVRAAEVQDVDGRYSAVIFWHSLEHLRQPVRALRHAATLVAPGGLLVIAVPNAASTQARVFGDRWLHLDVPRHLVHITPEALISTVESLGLKVERVSYSRGGQVLFGWLHGLVAQFPGHPDLYDAIRRPDARHDAQHPLSRLYTLGAGVAMLPAALAASVVEVARRRGGSIYVEARRPG
jgi:SAM-dependent methyltransferase